MIQFMWVNVHSLNGRRMIRSPCRSHHDGLAGGWIVVGSMVLVMSVPAVVDSVLGSARCGRVALELLTQCQPTRLARGLEEAVHDRQHGHAGQVVLRRAGADDVGG